VNSSHPTLTLLLLIPGYFLLNRRNSSSTYVVLANGGNGALYGTLELARQLLLGHTVADTFVRGARFPYRALKFNLPASPYRPGKATALHADTVQSFDFWRAFLDMMARNRYNVLSLWQLHPWQFLVKPRNFPHAALPAPELRKWRALYAFIFKEAQDRGIDPYLVNWNVFVSEPFKRAYDPNATADTAGPGPGAGCTDEVVKVYNREVITQVLEEFSDLAGVGLTFGDRMKSMSTQAQVKWVEEVSHCVAVSGLDKMHFTPALAGGLFCRNQGCEPHPSSKADLQGGAQGWR
jgi:hypothetical protein